jgi:hypothetical protein
VNDLGLGTWFQPSVSVQRRGVEMGDSANPVILRGDVLHTDFGITALGLNTDTQHMGYVLREGETDRRRACGTRWARIEPAAGPAAGGDGAGPHGQRRAGPHAGPDAGGRH